MNKIKNNVIAHAIRVVEMEIDALAMMSARIGDELILAIEIIRSMRGRIVVVGMGKSGIVGRKIAATLASTGTPAFFVHPGEAYHGDLGMIKPIDVALLISNSGETEEVLRLIPFLKFQDNKIISFVGNLNSSIAKNSDVVLNTGVDREACLNNLAPTSSTTCTMVMGDALAVSLAELNNFKPQDFARFHPGGNLGRKLLTKVKDVMSDKNLPFSSINTNFADLVYTINKGRLGLAIVIEDDGLIGVVTDGDIRRGFASGIELNSITAATIMTKNPITINQDQMISDAELILQDSKINSLIVLDGASVVGVLQIYNI